jgi:SAM-dependent methyltransferase
LAFWGLKPKQTVIEISPGGGYWTEILAPYAKATGGTYVAGVTDLSNPKTSDRAKKGRADFEARFADPAKVRQASVRQFRRQSGPLGKPGSADLVLTARNVHNWTGAPGMADKVFADFFAVLKPGGLLAIEDHRADPRSEKDAGADGYLNTATVIALARRPASSWTPSPRSTPTRRTPRIIRSASGPCRPHDNRRRRAAAVQPELRPHQVRGHRRERPHDPALPQACLIWPA